MMLFTSPGLRAWLLVGLAVALNVHGCAGGSAPADRAAPAAATEAEEGEAAGLARHEGDGLEVTLLELRRAGPDTVLVRWRYRNITSQRRPLGRGPRAVESVLDASALLEAASRTTYLVVRDAADRPVGGVEAGPTTLDLGAGQEAVVWAKFLAPPPDVATITISVPGAPPFAAVPLEAAAAR